MFITCTATSIRVLRGSGSIPASAGTGNGVALPVRHGAERRRRGQQVVQMRGAGAGQARDDDRGEQVDVVYLRMTREQIGEQQPVLQPLQ